MKPRSRIETTGLLALLLVVVTVALCGWYYISTVSKPLDFGDELFVVKKGDTLSSIAQRLTDTGVIDEPYTLKIMGRLNSRGSSIKAGEYRFPESITMEEFLGWLVSGKGQVGNRITILEGWTFRQMREAINKADKISNITRDWSDQRIMEEMGHPELHPEGQFFPDTYQFLRGESDINIYRTAFNLMQQKLDKLWSERSDDLQLDSRYEALIMASIIEKESQYKEEIREIAGVFSNRLEKGMRLQTDPTVIYGLGDEFDGNITRAHLRADGPYNTYTRAGLPPTPISLPGYDSLYAAVNPVDTSSLYFVSMGNGKHKFSATLKEHNAAVRKYILKK